MSASSEANSRSSFFAISKQTAKGTAGTVFFRALATVSSLGLEFEYRDNRIEHPSVIPSTSWLVAYAQEAIGYKATATVTFALRPRFIVPVLMACGYKVVTTGTTSFTHVLTQDTDANHKWFTLAWNVEETDGAFVTRAVDARCTSLSMEVTPEEIMCTAEFRGLKLEPMAGSPTYTDEVADEIVPWLGTRTTMTIGAYPVVERIRSITIAATNELREDDRAIWEPVQVGLGRQSFGVDFTVADANISDDLYEALNYGAANGTAVPTTPITGALDVNWVSAANIPTTAVPYKFQFAASPVQWKPDGAPEANGEDLITINTVGTVVASVAIPNTITVVNAVATY